MGYWSTNSPTSPRTAYLGFPNASAVNFCMWASPSIVTIANTVTQTSLFSGAISQGSLTIPANYLLPATQMRLVLRGYIGTAAAVPNGTLTITLGGTTIYSFGPAAVASAQITAAAFELGLEIGVRTIGASGTVTCNGVMWTNNANALGLSPTTDQTGTVNTTTALTLSALWTWGTADPLNTLTTASAVVEIMG